MIQIGKFKLKVKHAMTAFSSFPSFLLSVATLWLQSRCIKLFIWFMCWFWGRGMEKNIEQSNKTFIVNWKVLTWILVLPFVSMLNPGIYNLNGDKLTERKWLNRKKKKKLFWLFIRKKENSLIIKWLLAMVLLKRCCATKYTGMWSGLVHLAGIRHPPECFSEQG